MRGAALYAFALQQGSYGRRWAYAFALRQGSAGRTSSRYERHFAPTGESRVRVIAGTLKGRRLKPPTWDGLRPTSDKLRETLFNILAPRIAGARVLDGYAGTGALGIEALSRGAAQVTFVEQRSARAGADRREPGALRGRRAAILLSARAWPRAIASLGAPLDAVRHHPARSAVRRPAGRRARLRRRGDAARAGRHAWCSSTRAGSRRRTRAGAARSRVAQVTSGDRALAFYELNACRIDCPPRGLSRARSIR